MLQNLKTVSIISAKLNSSSQQLINPCAVIEYSNNKDVAYLLKCQPDNLSNSNSVRK